MIGYPQLDSHVIIFEKFSNKIHAPKIGHETNKMSTSLPQSLLLLNNTKNQNFQKTKRGGKGEGGKNTKKKSRKEMRREERMTKKRNQFRHQLENGGEASCHKEVVQNRRL